MNVNIETTTTTTKRDCHFESPKNFSNVISILWWYLEQKYFLQVQYNYVLNLFQLNHEEPEKSQQKFFGFFIVDVEHASICFDYFQ